MSSFYRIWGLGLFAAVFFCNKLPSMTPNEQVLLVMSMLYFVGADVIDIKKWRDKQ